MARITYTASRRGHESYFARCQIVPFSIAKERVLRSSTEANIYLRTAERGLRGHSGILSFPTDVNKWVMLETTADNRTFGNDYFQQYSPTNSNIRNQVEAFDLTPYKDIETRSYGFHHEEQDETIPVNTFDFPCFILILLNWNEKIKDMKSF